MGVSALITGGWISLPKKVEVTADIIASVVEADPEITAVVEDPTAVPAVADEVF